MAPFGFVSGITALVVLGKFIGAGQTAEAVGTGVWLIGAITFAFFAENT